MTGSSVVYVTLTKHRNIFNHDDIHVVCHLENWWYAISVPGGLEEVWAPDWEFSGLVRGTTWGGFVLLKQQWGIKLGVSMKYEEIVYTLCCMISTKIVCHELMSLVVIKTGFERVAKINRKMFS